ncbi:MAG TPA: zinc-ribbon domain-containing protein [Polyangiaceae bacterium]|nr:zinc-ribbon domain-containing protein [Polyangiaceae bacterium]
MKISCQSCQSKYNVADEKVHGKIVKIRCRKCGSTIVVDGTKQGTANGSIGPSAGSVSSAPGIAVPQPTISKAETTQPWHVNVAEDDQRTMTLAELVTAYGSGVVTQETYIWTEGMDDWKPLSEVEAVVLALHDAAAASQPSAAGMLSSNGFGSDLRVGSGPGPDASASMSLSENNAIDGSDATRVYEGSRPSAAQATPSGSLAAAAPARAEPKRAAVRREPRTRDLFASRVNPDELRGGGGGDSGAAMLQMSASAPVDDLAAKRLGERNENSVLFSLAVLTKTAETRTSNDPGSGSGDDDSGLIDLKALAAKTESLRPGAVATDAAFSAPLGAATPIIAPLGTVASPLGEAVGKGRLPLVIGTAAVVVLLLVAGGIFIGVKLVGTPAPVAPVAVAPATAVPTAAASASADTPPSAPASASPSAAAAATTSATGAKPQPHGSGGAVGAGARPQVSRPAGPAAGGAGETPPPAPKKGGDCGCNGDLMCLMKCSTH